MAYSEKTIKMLWGRAANLCAICRQPLILDGTGADDESVVGDIAHIIARDEDGERAARAVARLTTEEAVRFANLIDKRNKYPNLILLCKIDHKMVDDQENTYSIGTLVDLKQAHETWVTKCLTSYDAKRQADDEDYASYVDYWVDKLRIFQWGWTSRIFSFGQPSVPTLVLKDLRQLNEWLLTRIWPGRYPALEESFMEFRWIVNDFILVFERHASPGEEILWTEKFYQRAYGCPFDPGQLNRLEEEFEDHVALVQDLGAELIRSANRVCDRVRSVLDRTFLMDVGRLTIEEGPDYQLRWRQLVTQYRGDERYGGLDVFATDRGTRDVHYGSRRPASS